MKNPDFKKMENIFLFNEIFNRQSYPKSTNKGCSIENVRRWNNVSSPDPN